MHLTESCLQADLQAAASLSHVPPLQISGCSYYANALSTLLRVGVDTLSVLHYSTLKALCTWLIHCQLFSNITSDIGLSIQTKAKVTIAIMPFFIFLVKNGAFLLITLGVFL